MRIITLETRKMVPTRPTSWMRKVMNFIFDARPHDPPNICFGSLLGNDLPPVLSPSELFANQVRQSSDVTQILESFQHEIQTKYSGLELTPFVKILMKKAKSFYLVEKDLDASLRIWRYIYEQNINNERSIVIHSMIAIAKELVVGIPFKDLDAAIKIWTSALNLDNRGKDTKKILGSMTVAANFLVEPALPPAQRDFKGALKLWSCSLMLSSTYGQRKAIRASMLRLTDRMLMHKAIDDALKVWQFLYATLPTSGEKNFIVRNMADAASFLSVVDFSKREWDIPAAIKIWEKAFPLDNNPGKLISRIEKIAMKLADPRPPIGQRDIDSAILICELLFKLPLTDSEVSDLSHRLFELADNLVSPSLSASEKDTLSAIKIWKFLYRIFPERQLSIIKNMMHMCNLLTDADKAELLRDIDCAITVWQAVFDLNFSNDQNDRVVATMKDAANKLAFKKQDWANAHKLRQAAEELKAKL